MWEVLVGLKVLDTEKVGDCGLAEENSEKLGMGEEMVLLTLLLSVLNGLNLCE